MTGGALHLLLAVALATPPGSADLDPSACAASDFRCLGTAYVASARAATSGKQRAQYLYSAHRAFLHQFDRSQDSRYLCQAHELIRQARKVPANHLGQRLEDSERETLSRLRSGGVECSPGRARRPRSSRAAATAPTTTSTTTSTTPPSAGEPESTPQPPVARTEDRADPTPVPTATLTGSSDRPQPQPVRTSSPSSGQLADRTQVEHGAPVFATKARPAKSLMIGGGVAVGMSLVLGGVATYLYTQGLEILDRAIVVENEHRDFPQFSSLRRDYDHLNQWAYVAAFSGGAALVTGITLLAVGARRRSKALAIGPMIRPGGGGGLLVTGRF